MVFCASPRLPLVTQRTSFADPVTFLPPARAVSRGLFEKEELSRNTLLASRTRKRVSCVSQQLITWRNLT
jgi:hypothetical protein